MISVAYAAAEEGAHHAEAFYQAAEFWVAIAFLIVVALAGRAIWRTIVTALDNRAASIQARVEEAEKLRIEAEELLASYRRKQRDAVNETAAIVERAREEAVRLGERLSADLDRAITRREQQAKDRIAQAEASAVDEVRAAAVDVAMEATRRVLAETIKDKKADALIDDTIKDLPNRLH